MELLNNCHFIKILILFSKNGAETQLLVLMGVNHSKLFILYSNFFTKFKVTPHFG